MHKTDYNPLVPAGNAMERIRMMQPSFSKSHKKIADFILQNYEKAVFLTSFKMGQQCGVSESSIIRFATTLGYSGYSEFQREIQDLLKTQITMSQRLKETSLSGDGGIMQGMMQKGIDGIQYAMMNLNEKDFDRAVAVLSQAKRVFLVGSRSSYGLVYYFAFVLNWIRESVFAVNCSNEIIDYLATLTEDDAVLAISLPKYPKSTVDALEAARSKGAHTIAITDTMTSPLIPHSEISLLVYTELLSYSDNIAPVMCLITALLTAIGAADPQKTAGLLEKHEALWEESGIYA